MMSDIARLNMWQETQWSMEFVTDKVKRAVESGHSISTEKSMKNSTVVL